QRPVPGARTRRTTVLRAIRGARGGCEGPRRVRSCRTRESEGREGILLHVRPGRGIHPQGTCGDQFAVRLYHRGETRDRCRHAYPATSEGADAQGGLTQLRTSGERRLPALPFTNWFDVGRSRNEEAGGKQGRGSFTLLVSLNVP